MAGKRELTEIAASGSGYVGVDGCAGGWFAVARARRGYAFGVFTDFAELAPHIGGARRVLVDMPIGLPEHAPRQCDFAARRLLPAGRRSAVFPVAVRQAVYASSYAQACAVNAARLGKRLSRQSWNLCRKIRELDAVLRAHPAMVQTVLEAHPELCFAALGGDALVQESKKTPAGQRRRLELIIAHWPRAAEIYAAALAAYPRKQLARDDVIDALVLALAGSRRLRGVLPQAELDACGLPMQIVYPT